ncbi:hypothetical protein SBA5_550030 [Candidatus Sulfotelmatomonas gaucii]|uniref:Uncharacterized protein n=1 Tax=Candidatus Sulfuritelmatomonas gaucii TaxID=2043161 RepID=A0A2N9LTQ5_9BACT|nr:hypothetical protein SBA5_550030 [Candidatus Sulfotelmatomonas gaucii]
MGLAGIETPDLAGIGSQYNIRSNNYLMDAKELALDSGSRVPWFGVSGLLIAARSRSRNWEPHRSVSPGCQRGSNEIVLACKGGSG